jgi:acyl-coenzyme A synthetase/AMP-(fatty) acid ligase
MFDQLNMPVRTPMHPSLDNLSIQPSVPELLDFHLKHNPDFPLYVFSNDDSDHLTEISMLEYVRAAHRAGAAIRSTGNSQPGEIIGIIAHLDSIVGSAIITGMMKIGLVVSGKAFGYIPSRLTFFPKPFPISYLLDPTAVAKTILEGNNIHRVLVTSATLCDFLASVRAKLDPSYDCHFEEAPSLSVIYPKLGRETVEDDFLPLSDLHCSNDQDLAICTHSSGSTGMPKTIPFTHRAFKSWAAGCKHRFLSSIPSAHYLCVSRYNEFTGRSRPSCWIWQILLSCIRNG